MKKDIIRNAYAVGMQYSGVKQHEVEPLYFCSKESSNPGDLNAVAVYVDESLRHRVCCLRKEDALKLKDILTCVQYLCYLRAIICPQKVFPSRDPCKTTAMPSNAMPPTLNAWQHTCSWIAVWRFGLEMLIYFIV